MHLGIKTLLGLGASFALWCALLYWANAALLRPSFLALETRTVERNCDRAKQAIAAKSDEVSAKVGDWSIWDDTYQFIVDRNQSYFDSNLSAESINTLGLDFIAFINSNHEVVHVETCGTGAALQVGRETIATLVQFDPRLLRHDHAYASHRGLMRIGEHLVALASRPIHRSDGSGTCRGSLLAGRLLTHEMVGKLSQQTQLQLAVVTGAPGDLRPLVTCDADFARGRLGLFDLFGRPVGSCTVTMPREIVKEGESALNLLLVALLVSSGLALLTTVCGFDMFVLRRLRKLRSTIRDINATGDLTQRVELSGNDEVTELATAFNQLASTLHATQDKLIAATNTRTQFLANVSHEVRTPVTSLIGFAELLKDPRLSRSQHDDFVETIRRNASHLLTLLNDLLDTAKIESGQMTIEKLGTPVGELVLDILDLARPEARKKRLELEAAVLGRIPAEVRTDPTRLRQILANLVGNAIKFTDRGSIKVTVSAPRAGLLQFDVADTGIGIPADKLGRLFLPFTQADASTSRRFGGTGLGLALSRNLARMLGGDVSVVSEAGRGSTFTVLIAAQATSATDSTTELSRTRTTASHNHHEAPPQPLLDRRILVADDAADNRRLVSFLLRRAGARVDLASNGKEAIDQAIAAETAHQPFDLIVMDMQMPVQNGYEATAELRRRGFAMPILALTANALQSDEDACLRAGCNEHATKPIDSAALLAAIARYFPAASESGTASLTDSEPTCSWLS